MTTTSSLARRPTTRSQTGTIPKRRTRDDDLPSNAKKQAHPAPKRLKSSSASACSHTRAGSPLTREPSPSSTTSASNREDTLAFYHTSVSDADAGLRSRASLPTPIPNLTKKSRGRRVPTKDNPDSTQGEDRLYVCSVEGCAKCFHRGEHLKRHIRSIHTHEKRISAVISCSRHLLIISLAFKCTFSRCEKYFNRHDNLLQHLKVHRQAASPPNQSPPVEEPLELSASRRPQGRHQRAYSQPEEDNDEPSPPPPVPPAPRPRTIYDAYPPRFGSYPTTSSVTIPEMIHGHFNNQKHAPSNNENDNVIDGVVSMHGDMAANEAMTILTNVAVSSLRMEVSSLRTELPRSSNDLGTMVGVMQMNPC